MQRFLNFDHPSIESSNTTIYDAIWCIRKLHSHICHPIIVTYAFHANDWIEEIMNNPISNDILEDLVHMIKAYLENKRYVHVRSTTKDSKCEG